MFYQLNFINYKNNIQKINIVDMKDCFSYDQNIQLFTGENAMFCSSCQKTCPSLYCTKIYSGPTILVIVLNRGKGVEFNVKLNFTEDLDLMDFIECKQLGYKYKLIGVVTHMGESGAGGHFIAFCKNPIDNNWYKYNDEFVSKVNNFQKEIIDYARPYILFYRKAQ